MQLLNGNHSCTEKDIPSKARGGHHFLKDNSFIQTGVEHCTPTLHDFDVVEHVMLLHTEAVLQR
jgi:hypothetical protein